MSPFRIRPPSLRLGKHLRLSLGRRGPSLSAGAGRLRTTIGPDGVKETVHIAPGVSYTTGGRRRHGVGRRAGCLGCLVPALLAVALVAALVAALV